MRSTYVFIHTANKYFLRACCRFWGYYNHQKTKSLPLCTLNCLGEDGKQASAYVTSSQCWYMQRRKMEQNMKKLTALLILGNMYWSVVNSTCTDSFYTLSMLGGTHLCNYDIIVLEFSRVSLVTCPVGRARQDLCPSSLASSLLFFFFLCWFLIAVCRLSLAVANRDYSSLQCMASHWHGFSYCGTWTLEHTGFSTVACRLRSCSLWALGCGL